MIERTELIESARILREEAARLERLAGVRDDNSESSTGKVDLNNLVDQVDALSPAQRMQLLSRVASQYFSTTIQAALQKGLTQGYIGDLIRQRKLPAVRIADANLIPNEALDDFTPPGKGNPIKP